MQPTLHQQRQQPVRLQGGGSFVRVQGGGNGTGKSREDARHDSISSHVPMPQAGQIVKAIQGKLVKVNQDMVLLREGDETNDPSGCHCWFTGSSSISSWCWG